LKSNTIDVCKLKNYFVSFISIKNVFMYICVYVKWADGFFFQIIYFHQCMSRFLILSNERGHKLHTFTKVQKREGEMGSHVEDFSTVLRGNEN